MNFRNLVARIFSEDDEISEDESNEKENDEKQKKEKGSRMPKSRNSDWNEVISDDVEVDVFKKVYAGLTDSAQSRSLVPNTSSSLNQMMKNNKSSIRKQII